MNEVVWSAIGAGTVFGLSGGFSPGPLLVLVISETLRHGLRVGIMVAITPLLTDFPVMLVAILLLNQLTHFDLLLGGISLAGAIFLLRIGWLSLKTAPIIPGEGEVGDRWWHWLPCCCNERCGAASARTSASPNHEGDLVFLW